PAANQGNHFQAKFAMGQRPPPFFFGPISHVVTWALRLPTTTHHNGQPPEAIQLHHRAMAVVAHPQRLAALLTMLFQWGQRHRVRGYRTRGSSGHASSPVVLILLLPPLDYTQATPAVKLSFPFREKKSILDPYKLYIL